MFTLPKRDEVREDDFFREGEKLELTGFSYSYWARNIDNRISGYCFKLNKSSCAISWDNDLEKCVSNSKAEAELYAVVEASNETVHLANLLRELGLVVWKSSSQ